MTGRDPIRAGICVALLASSTLAADGPSSPAAGPFAVTMTVEEALRALPSADKTLSPYAGRVVSVATDWTHAEQAYRVMLRPMRYGAAKLTLRSEQKVRNSRACRERVTALAAYFETDFGALAPSASDSTSFDTLKVGRTARVGEAELEIDGERFGDASVFAWFFSQPAAGDRRYAIVASAQYTPFTDKCAIAADVTVAKVGRPAYETMDVSALKAVQQPTRFDLSDSIEGLTLPKAGVTVALDCEVVRGNGRIRDCFSGERGKPLSQEARAAVRRLNATVFDPKQLDPDNDVPLRGVFSVKLKPGDRMKAPALPLPTVMVPPPRSADNTINHVWAYSPAPGEVSKLYPARALDAGIEGRITADCTVREDLSLRCINVASTPSNDSAFEEAALKVIALHRVAPVMRDGTLAAGAEFPLAVKFRVE